MTIEISATARYATGNGASRRLRRTGRIPAVDLWRRQGCRSHRTGSQEVFYKLKNESFHATILKCEPRRQGRAGTAA